MTIYGDTADDIGFVYVWLNRSNGRYYIGSHKGSPDDGYIGSGSAFKAAVKKHGLENFHRTIDYIGPDFRQEETDLIAFFDACNCPLGYNLQHFHNDGLVIGPDTRHRMSNAKKGRTSPRKGVKLSDETKAKLRAANQGQGVGRRLSAETRQRMSLSMIGNKNGNGSNQHT